MTAPVSSQVAGRTASAAPDRVRFHQLRDASWWQINGHQSNVAIGTILGCSHETVRLARLEMGVEPITRGRARGERPPDAQSPIDGLTNFERRLIDRYRADRRAAPTRELLSRRIVAAHEAHAAGDQLAYEGAMLDVATGAARIAEHEQKLRRAA